MEGVQRSTSCSPMQACAHFQSHEKVRCQMQYRLPRGRVKLIILTFLDCCKILAIERAHSLSFALAVREVPCVFYSILVFLLLFGFAVG